jgi:hypothetical protein
LTGKSSRFHAPPARLDPARRLCRHSGFDSAGLVERGYVQVGELEGTMSGFDEWLLRSVNKFTSHYLGFTFDATAEFIVPTIILGGIVIAWIAYRPRRTRY